MAGRPINLPETREILQRSRSWQQRSRLHHPTTCARGLMADWKGQKHLCRRAPRHADKVDPGLRCGLRREATHEAERTSRSNLNADATGSINDNRVICHPPTWRVPRSLLHLRIYIPVQRAALLNRLKMLQLNQFSQSLVKRRFAHAPELPPLGTVGFFSRARAGRYLRCLRAIGDRHARHLEFRGLPATRGGLA